MSQEHSSASSNLAYSTKKNNRKGRRYMEIGSKVKIIFGSDKGHEGIYFGMKNNSNWHIVKISDGSFVYVNLDEIEEIK